MRELDLLEHMERRAREYLGRFDQVLIGPGDDCAVVRSPSGDAMLLTVDHVVEGRHVPRLTRPASVEALEAMARKALARSLSDIAAMGGLPVAALATACFPEGFDHEDAQRLADALHRCGANWSCPVVGGDVSTFGGGESEVVVLTTTVLGAAHQAGAILRSTARVGDTVYVTGAIGGAVSSGRHMTFQPRLAEARELSEALLGARPTAMIDISDGLGMDASRIGRASGVLLAIEAKWIPLSPGVSDWSEAVAEGEDYELLFTVPSDANVPTRLGSTPVTRIGRVEAAGDGHAGCVIVSPDGQRYDAGRAGFAHGDD